MKNKIIIASALSGLLLCSCAEKETGQTTETAASQTSAAISVTSQTTFTETASETAPKTTETDKAPISFAPYFTSAADTSDHAERFCGWLFDSSADVYTAAEFYGEGGTEEMLAAAEAAVRNSELFKESELICRTAALGEDGVFYYSVPNGEEISLKGIFSLSSKAIDEKGHALASFKSGVVFDFDGDGKKEAFILMTIPDAENTFGYTNDCAVYVNSSGEAQLLTSGVDGYIRLIKYDGFAHAALSFGCNNITTFSEIYGSENGKAELLHQASFIGDKKGLAMCESAPQAFGNWLVIWDNIDKAYREIAADEAPEGLAEEIYSSPLLDDIKEYFDYTEAPKWLESPESLSEVMCVFGGKYVCIGEFYDSCTLEYDDGGFVITNDRIINTGYENSAYISVDLIAAEEMCAAPPVPPETENINAAPYTVTEEGVYLTPDELISAGGESLLNTAVKAVMESREYKEISYQISNAERNGNTCTFPVFSYANEYAEGESYTYDSAFFAEGEISPLFGAAAYRDFDGDGANEAFITLRLPYKGYFYRNGEETSEQLITVFVSSDGKTQLMDTGAYFMKDISDMSIILYGNESHLIMSGEIYSVRNGSPRFETAASPDENGVSFARCVFYSSELQKYCYAKYVPLDDDILKALIASPAAENKEYSPRRGWICGKKFIITDSYSFGEYLYENGSFTRISEYGGGEPRTNGELYCYEVSF